MEPEQLSALVRGPLAKVALKAGQSLRVSNQEQKRVDHLAGEVNRSREQNFTLQSAESRDQTRWIRQSLEQTFTQERGILVKQFHSFSKKITASDISPDLITPRRGGGPGHCRTMQDDYYQ